MFNLSTNIHLHSSMFIHVHDRIRLTPILTELANYPSPPGEDDDPGFIDFRDSRRSIKGQPSPIRNLVEAPFQGLESQIQVPVSTSVLHLFTNMSLCTAIPNGLSTFSPTYIASLVLFSYAVPSSFVSSSDSRCKERGGPRGAHSSRSERATSIQEPAISDSAGSHFGEAQFHCARTEEEQEKYK